MCVGLEVGVLRGRGLVVGRVEEVGLGLGRGWVGELCHGQDRIYGDNLGRVVRWELVW